MLKVPKMVDMALSDEKQEEMAVPMGMAPKYPWGLSISLCQDELEKLDADYSDWSVGDIFHLHAFAKITSISRNATQEDGENCRVEMQIVAMSAESEDEENEEAEKAMSPRKKMYKA